MELRKTQDAGFSCAMSLLSLVFMALRAVIFGFFGAAVAYFILREAMRFRAEWSKVLPIAFLANFVCAISERALIGYFDPKAPGFFFDYTCAIVGTALVFATVASRVGIKSESGRSLSWVSALAAGFCVVGPALTVGILAVVAFSSLE